MKDIQIEVGERRRIISGGLKVYGTAEDLTALRDAITEALNSGLVQGWVGIGLLPDDHTTFPYNGKQGIPVSTWREASQ